MNDVQLELKLREPRKIVVDGVVDRHGIRLLGTAVEQPDGTFRALADVEGCLCAVELQVVPRKGA